MLHHPCRYGKTIKKLTFRFHSPSFNFGLMVSRFAAGGISPFSMALTTLTILARPDAHSVCPTFGLIDPIGSGLAVDLESLNTAPMAPTSRGSPVGVPVPWAWTNLVTDIQGSRKAHTSKYPVSFGSNPAFLYTRRISSICAAWLGVVIVSVFPS